MQPCAGRGGAAFPPPNTSNNANHLSVHARQRCGCQAVVAAGAAALDKCHLAACHMDEAAPGGGPPSGATAGEDATKGVAGAGSGEVADEGAVALRTKRCTLRRLSAALGDARAIAAYRGLPEVARYQSWSSFTTDDAAALIASQQGVRENEHDTWLQLAIVLAVEGDDPTGGCGGGSTGVGGAGRGVGEGGSKAPDAGRVVGDVGVHFVDDDALELGITVSPHVQRTGIASEALVAAIEHYAFGAAAAVPRKQVTAVTDAANAGAVALFRKLGFDVLRRRDGVVFKGELGAELDWVLTAEKWASRDAQ